MTRDPALIRALLIYTELHQDGNQPLGFPIRSDVATWLPDYKLPQDLPIPSIPNFLSAHIQMMIDSKLAVGTVYVDQTCWQGVIVHGTIPDPWFDKLTPEGYDLLAALKNATVWNTVSAKIAKVGGSFTMATLKAISVKALADLIG